MSRVEEILAEREKVHGSFETFALKAQALKDVLHSSGYNLDQIQREGLEMILHKVARVLNGNADHEDHWDDIAGYATLVSKYLAKRKQPCEASTTLI